MPGSKVIEEDRDGDGEIETNVVVPRYREKMHKKKKGGHTLNDLSSFGMPMSDQPSAGQNLSRSSSLV